MPREYQVKKENPYYVPHNLYMQGVYLIKGYGDLLRQRERLLYGSPAPPDGMPRGNGQSDPTGQRAVLLASLDTRIQAVEQTISELRGKYQKTYTGEIFNPYEAFFDYGVFCYYRSKKGREEAPDYKTWKRYRSEFVRKVLEKMSYF